MATAKLSVGLTRISGKVGGTVFRRGRGGQVMQAAARRIANQSPAWIARKKAFSQAQHFCGDIERAGNIPLWRVFALNHPCKSCIGERKLRTWRQWAIKFNTIRYFNGLEPILTPPEN